ncbi:MAG: transcription antitermination factor NusB [Acidobacteria bacterium]|nr:MAG: transcription antitermination factor NusB [Acidobacteriota bacterium]
MRHKAREFALQVLYALDLNPIPPHDFMNMFWEIHSPKKEIIDYASHLILGTLSRRKDIDALIAEHSNNWKIGRMAVTDRNILRLGTFELLEEPTVPSKVVINEAIEIAKKFGSSDSATFVNGILDSIHQKLHPAGKSRHAS